MDKKFEVRVDREAEVPVIHLRGDITTFSDEIITHEYESIKFADSPKLIINFEEAKYINSAGIATLVGIVSDIERKKGILKFAGLAAHYRRVAEIVGITEYVELCDTVEEALKKIKKL